MSPSSCTEAEVFTVLWRGRPLGLFVREYALPGESGCNGLSIINGSKWLWHHEVIAMSEPTDSREPTKECTEARERSNANLKPFVKGQSGNPGGRKKPVITEAYDRLLEKKVPNDPEG